MSWRHNVLVRMHVVPAEAGIQRLKSLDPGLKHAGMTNMWDNSDSEPFIPLMKEVIQEHNAYH